MDGLEEISGRGPLSDIVVLEAGTMISSGTIGRLLADFGATVVKIEHPQKGDPLRDLPPKKDGVGLWWKYLSRNKKAITLDLSSQKGQTVFEDLACEADVVIENFRPGTLERWNLGYDILTDVNPDLIMIRVSGFGQTGPYSQRPGFGTLAEAMSGFAYVNGFSDSPPLLPKTGFADGIAALFATFSVMYALYHRDINDGSGQYIDTSLIEPIFSILGPQPLQFDQIDEIDRRTGNQSNISAPRNVYRTADDQWVALSASVQSLAMRLLEAIERPDLKDDPRFEDNESRVEHADELDDIVQSWMSEQSRDEALEVFYEHEIPIAPVYNIRDIMNDEHYQERGAVVTVEDDELGEAKVQDVFPKLSETPGEVEHLGPERREHNELVYHKALGYDSALLDQLETDGVI